MFCLGSAAQNANEMENDTVACEMEIPVDPSSMFTMVQAYAPLTRNLAPVKEKMYPLGKGLFKKHLIEQAIEICPGISKSKVSQSELLTGENIDEIADTGYGLDCGYSVIFVPGHEENGKLRLNKAGFAYSLGISASFAQSDRYGTLCDFMAKIGIEACHNKRMGIKFDFLAGYGKSGGDVFFYKNIVEDSEPSSSVPYNAWCPKFGGQISVKTGFLSNTLNNTDVFLFARLVKAVNPDYMNEFSAFHHNFWRGENWCFGATLRYRM